MKCTASVGCDKEAEFQDNNGFYYCTFHAERARENVKEVEIESFELNRIS